MEFNFTDFDQFLFFLQYETRAEKMEKFINKYGDSFIIDNFRNDYLAYMANGVETTYLDNYYKFSKYLNDNDTKLAVLGKYALDFIFFGIAKKFGFEDELEDYELSESVKNRLNLYGHLGINLIASEIISSKDIDFDIFTYFS